MSLVEVFNTIQDLPRDLQKENLRRVFGGSDAFLGLFELTDQELLLRFQEDSRVLDHGTRLYFILLIDIGQTKNIDESVERMCDYVHTVETDDLYYLVFGNLHQQFVRRELAQRIANDPMIDYKKLYTIRDELKADNRSFDNFMVFYVLFEAYCARREDIYMPLYLEYREKHDEMLPSIVLRASPHAKQIIEVSSHRDDWSMTHALLDSSFERVMFVSRVISLKHILKISSRSDLNAALAIITQDFTDLDRKTKDIVDGQV